MFAALVACARVPGDVGAPPYILTLAVACVAYLLAIREFIRTRRYPRHVLFACLALAALWRVPFFLIPQEAGAGIRRYVWDGRFPRVSLNPYTATPGGPTPAALH